MQTDVLLDNDFDLIDGADDEFAEGAADEANVELITLFNKGELRQYPFIGFGIERRLKEVANKQAFIRDLKVEIERDGYTEPFVITSDDLSSLKVEI